MKVSAERLSVLREISVAERLVRTLNIGSCLNLEFVQQLMEKYLKMDSYELEEATRVFLEFQRYEQEEARQAAKKLTRLLMTMNQMQVEIRKIGEKPSGKAPDKQILQEQIRYYQDRMKVWQTNYAERLKEIYHKILQYEGADSLLLKEQETDTRRELDRIYAELRILAGENADQEQVRESRRAGGGQVCLAIAKPYHRMLERSSHLSHMMDYKERWKVAVDYRFKFQLQLKKQHLQEWIRNMEAERFREVAGSLERLERLEEGALNLSERGQEASILDVFGSRLSRFIQENRELLEAQPESIRLMNYKLPLLEALGEIRDDKSLNTVWKVLEAGGYVVGKDGVEEGEREEKTRYLQELIENMEEEQWKSLYQVFFIEEADGRKQDNWLLQRFHEALSLFTLENHKLLEVQSEEVRLMNYKLPLLNALQEIGDYGELESVMHFLKLEGHLSKETESSFGLHELEEVKTGLKELIQNMEEKNWIILYQSLIDNQLKSDAPPLRTEYEEETHFLEMFHKRLSKIMEETNRQMFSELVEEAGDIEELKAVLQLLSGEGQIRESSNQESEWLLHRIEDEQILLSLEEEKKQIQEYLKSLNESHWEALYQNIEKNYLVKKQVEEKFPEQKYTENNSGRQELHSETNITETIENKGADDPENTVTAGEADWNFVEFFHERLSGVMDETRRQTLSELVEEVSEDSEMRAVLQLLSKEAQTFVSLEEDKERVQEYLKSLEESHWESLYQSIEKKYLEKKQIEKKKKEQEQIEKSSRSYELNREGYSKETVESKVVDDAGTLIIVGDVKKNLVEVFHERLSRVMDETRRQTLLELVEEVSEDSEMEAVLQLLSKEAGTFVSLEEEKKRVQEHLKSLEESHWESLYQSIEKNYLEKKQIEKKKKEQEQIEQEQIEQEQIEQEQIEQEQIEKSSRSYELGREGYSKETVESKVVDDAGAIVTVGGAKQNLVEVFHERLSRVMDKTRRQTLLELVEEVSEDSEMEAVLQLLSKETQTSISLEEEKKRVQEHLKSLEESHWESLYQSIEKNYLEQKQIEQNQIKQKQIEMSSRSYEPDREGNTKETIENRVVEDTRGIGIRNKTEGDLVEAFHKKLSGIIEETRKNTLLQLVEEVSESRELEAVLHLLSGDTYDSENSNAESSNQALTSLLHRTNQSPTFDSLSEEKKRVQEYLKLLDENHWETLYQRVEKNHQIYHDKQSQQDRSSRKKERIADSFGETEKQTLLDLVQQVENTEQLHVVLELLEHKSHLRKEEKRFLAQQIYDLERNSTHSLSREEKDFEVSGYRLWDLVQKENQTEVTFEEFRYDTASLITVRPPVPDRPGTMELSADIEHQISSQVREEVEDIRKIRLDKAYAGDTSLSSGQLESLVEKMELYQKELQEIKMIQTKLLKTTNSNQLVNHVMKRLQGELKVERLRRGLS